MSFSAAEADIRKYFADKWGEETPIAWPDMKFTPPDGTWIRFSMKNSAGFQASTGSPGGNFYRRRGLITIQVFQKEGQASADVRKKADIAANVFLPPNSLAGYRFRNVNARDIGPDGAGWYQWNVTAEYEYDITK